MRRKQPFYMRHTFGYVVVLLSISLVSAVLFTPLGNLVAKRLTDRFDPKPQSAGPDVPRTAGTSTLDPAPTGRTQPASKTQATLPPDRQPQIGAPPTDPQNEPLSLEYDSLNERFIAVNQSIMQRASDLGSLPLKPEIAAELATAKADLAATEQALQDRKWDVAKQRMKRVKETLNYLDSL
jgi:hypothetical protein